jgi:hypothetical protein
MSDIPCIVSRRSAGRSADKHRVHALLHTQRLSCPVCPRLLERLIASVLRHMPNNWVNSLHSPYYPCWVLDGFAEVNLFLGIDVQYEVYITGGLVGRTKKYMAGRVWHWLVLPPFRR